MAIDLFCYSVCPVSRANAVIDILRANNPSIFSEKFLISAASVAGDESKDTALEFGIRAQSVFVVCLNDKFESHQLQAVVELIGNGFGENEIVVLRDNEELM